VPPAPARHPPAVLEPPRNAVHRFFPDLDRRQNAPCDTGRWNALESAWIHGVNPETDRELT
jgi:hypothetical protein